MAAGLGERRRSGVRERRRRPGDLRRGGGDVCRPRSPRSPSLLRRSPRLSCCEPPCLLPLTPTLTYLNSNPNVRLVPRQRDVVTHI